MADRVHPSMHSVQPAKRDAVLTPPAPRPSSASCACDTTPCWRAASVAIASSTRRGARSVG